MPEHYDLETFRRRHFAPHYRPGHHVGIFGPTQLAGKTTLSFALLESIIDAHPEIRPVTFSMKHRDRVISAWTRRLGFMETPSWPPAPQVQRLWRGRPAGHTLWPAQSLTNVEADNALLQREFRKALVWNRKHTPSISHLNELYGMLAELGGPITLPSGRKQPGLRQLLIAIITRDSIAGHGAMYEAQKASGTVGNSIPGFFFNSAEHMFFSFDGVAQNRQRYADIACGIDPREIEAQTLALAHFSWLYIRRSGPEWCIVDAYDPALAV